MRCAVEAAAIRAEPREDAEQVTQALLREPLRVDRRSGHWVHVVTAYDYPGWMRQEDLEEGDGELPGPVFETPLDAARSFVGSPYRWGGLTSRGIDCSGLVHIAYRLSGRLVPRDAWQQDEAGTRVAPGAERPGDLVVYGAGGRADHIAFRLDGRRILHATGRSRLGVVIEDEPSALGEARRGIVRL